MMDYAGDILFVCVCLLFVAIGARRGFIRSAVHFLGALLSAFLASLLGGAVAQWVFDSFFRQALAERIGESLVSLGNGDAAAAVQQVLSSLPEFLQRALGEAGVTAGSIAEGFSAGSGQAAEVIAQGLSPVFVGFLKVLAVLVLYLLFMMLVRVLADLLAGMFQLPLLRQVNGLLGGVFGLLLSVVSLWVVLAAVQVFLPMLDSMTQAQVQQALDQSYVAGAIVEWNPLGFLFR